MRLSTRWRRSLAAFAVTGWLASANALAVEAPWCFSGTFIQFNEEDGQRDRRYWETLFRHFKRLRIETVIVQWASLRDVTFYPSRQLSSVKHPPLIPILEQAQRHGMRVQIGLAHDRGYWNVIEQADKSVFLRSHAQFSLTVAAELAPLVQRYRSFDGWYIGEEIDNLNWQNDVGRTALVGYLKEVVDGLTELTPGKPVAVSGFANGKAPSSELRSLWDDILKRVPKLSAVYFQDGVGVGHLTMAQLPEYLGAVADAARANKRRFVPIVEVFRQTGGPPLSEGDFKAVPAPLERVAAQYKIASQFSNDSLAFGIPEYFTPSGGAEATGAYWGYLAQMRSKRADCRD